MGSRLKTLTKWTTVVTSYDLSDLNQAELNS